MSRVCNPISTSTRWGPLSVLMITNVRPPAERMASGGSQSTSSLLASSTVTVTLSPAWYVLAEGGESKTTWIALSSLGPVPYGDGNWRIVPVSFTSESESSVTVTGISSNISFTSVSPLVASRSEEHTSELQSQSNLVCRLLLEKKKKTTYKQ